MPSFYGRDLLFLPVLAKELNLLLVWRSPVGKPMAPERKHSTHRAAHTTSKVTKSVVGEVISGSEKTPYVASLKSKRKLSITASGEADY